MRKKRKRYVRSSLLIPAIFILLAMGISFGLLEFCQYLRTTSYLEIKKIKIEGVDQELKKSIINLCGLRDVKMNYIFLNDNYLKQRIKMNPWVKSVKIEKKFPDTLIIKIQKETPYALVLIDGDIFYVDSSGDIFKKVRYGENINFPIITGLDNNSPNFKERLKKAIKILNILKKTNFSFFDISEIYINKYGNIHLYFCNTGIEVRLFHDITRLNKNEIKRKLNRLKKILNYFSNYGRIGNILFIDLDCMDEGAIIGLSK